jgi:hypothetical protein
MNATAYAYAIAELQPQVAASCPEMPLTLLRSACAVSTEALAAFASFLDSAAGVPGEGNSIADSHVTFARHPLVCSPPPAILGPLMGEAHRRVADHIRNGTELTIAERRNFSGVFMALLGAAHPRQCPFFELHDCTSLAMAVFLLEAGMNLGWCPNSYEGRGKRSAHLYFACAKKTLLTADTGQQALVLGYLWGAWLLAQKTEGLCDHALTHEKRDTSYTTAVFSDASNRSYSLFHFAQREKFLAVSHGTVLPACTFRRLSCEGLATLQLFAGPNPLVPFELLDVSSIERPLMSGIRMSYRCRAGQAIIRWLTAIQFFNCTVYRIDALRSEKGPVTLSDVKETFENDCALDARPGGFYKGRGPQNFCMQLIENPFSLVYMGQEEPGLSAFCGSTVTLDDSAPIQMTVAWRWGAGINDIDRTNLPGLFDV